MISSTNLSQLSAWLANYQVFSRYRLQWVCAIVFLLLAAAATLAVPLAFRGLVDAGFTSKEINDKFLQLLGLAAILAVVTASRFYLMSWLGERVVADVRSRVFENVLRQSPAYFETLQTGEVLSRLTSDTTLVQTLIGTSISMALRSAVMFVGAMIMMLITSAWLAALMGVLLLLVVLPIWALGRHVRKSSKVSQDRVADASAMAGEVLNAMSTVQAFNRESYERLRFNRSVETAFREAKRRIRLRSTLTAVAIMLAFSVITFVLWIGAQQVSASNMTLGELTQFVMYAVLIAGSIGALSEVWGDLQRAAGATERLVDLMRAKPALSNTAVTPPSRSRDVEETVNLSTSQQVSETALEFKEATFCYPSRPDYAALNHLSFKVASGARVALVGPSGAGKTTIFALLLRFYEPTSGRITVFDRDIRYWPTDALRDQIGIVPQDPVIFAASALDNIRYGRLEASDEEVVEAARTAHAHGFISALPEGYNSFLGERGVRLSGGQKQRISIARAILKNPPLLLLDEATSALDAESEQEVQRALESVLPGRTSLTIAHRLATVLHADQIIVMEAGGVVEQGRHTELIAQSGLYARLAKLQFANE